MQKEVADQVWNLWPNQFQFSSLQGAVCQSEKKIAPVSKSAMHGNRGKDTGIDNPKMGKRRNPDTVHSKMNHHRRAQAQSFHRHDRIRNSPAEMTKLRPPSNSNNDSNSTNETIWSAPARGLFAVSRSGGLLAVLSQSRQLHNLLTLLEIELLWA